MTTLFDEFLDERAVCLLAGCLALKLRAGDVLALRGNLGAGKTTFARALIRTVLDQPEADVPSPTFSLAQAYENDRLNLTHFDFYRLADPAETSEVGLEEALERGVAIVEWPERAGGLLGPDVVEIGFEANGDRDGRHVRISTGDRARSRLNRAIESFRFLGGRIAPDARLSYMQGDSSFRSYARVHEAGQTRILMDAPRMPNGGIIREGRTYSDISKLAEDVRPFVALAGGLRAIGLSAPEILAGDLNAGLLLVEDLGPRVFGKELSGKTGQAALWQAAVDVLLHLRKRGLAPMLGLPDGTHYQLPRRDRAAFEIEIDVLLDWYWPMAKGGAASDAVRRAYHAVWAPVIDRLLSLERGVFLRDFISPNLVWKPERQGVARVGLLDFQDALAEHWAFDLVSLLQDARVSVSRDLEAEMFAYYCDVVKRDEPDFDRTAFASAYSDFGAQRNTRIVGLWARLLKRDHQSSYLRFLPQTWAYLERDLEQPGLVEVKAWFSRHFPPDERRRVDFS
jgi:hypothetical protein